MKSIRFPLASLLFAAVASVSVAWADVLDTSLFAKKINFTVSGYAGASTLANFPVLVRLSDVSGFNFADFTTPVDELRFTDAAGNNLNYEIDTWNSSNALVWVSVSSLFGTASGTTTEIRAYFAPSSTSGLPAVSSNAVWSAAGYYGVWHMNEANATDSSANHLDGTADASITVVDAKIGAGANFPSNAKIATTNAPNEAFTSGISFETWARPSEVTGEYALFGKEALATFKIKEGKTRFTTPGKQDFDNVTAPVSANAWYHLVVAFVPKQAAKVYVNGALDKSQTDTKGGFNDLVKSYPIVFGSNQWNQYYKGILDECRLVTAALSDDWIAADYATQNNTNFLTSSSVTDSRSVDISLTQNGGTCASFSSLVDGFSLSGGQTATLKILYGTAEDALNSEFVVSDAVSASGLFPAQIKGLARGAAYYFKSVLVLPNGATVESAVLPVTMLADYTTAMRRVEYIEGNGTQYIDSGYYPTPNTHVRADYQFTAVANSYRVFGIEIAGSLYFNAYINSSGNFAYNMSDSKDNFKPVGNGTKGNTDRNLHDFNYINGESQRAYTIYGPDGSVTAAQASLAGTAMISTEETLTLAANRTSATGVNASTTAKHRIYSMLFDEGSALTAALAPAVRASDGAVGLYDSARNMFLQSASEVAYVLGPSMTTVEHYTGSALTAINLTFLGAPMARTLKVAYGSGFGGDNPADWDVTAAVATVAAGATSYSVPVPANWGSEDACVLRCYFDDGTTFPLWSDTVIYREATEPIVTGVTMDGSGGDALVIRGNLSYFPGSDCTLAVRVTKSGGSPVVWSNLTNVTEIGNFELTLESDPASPRYIEPGATYSVVVEATSGGKTGSSSAAFVTTAGAPVFVSSSSPVSRRTVTFTGNLADLGANTNAVVTLYVGTQNNANKLEAVETPAVRTTTGEFQIRHTFADFEKTYYWQFRAVATTAGGNAITTVTSVASCKTLDTTTYTWQAVGGEWNGNWSDTAHWADNQKGDCLGYPQSANATADFKNCTADKPVVVAVNGKYAIGELKYYGSAASDITFAGTSTNTSSLSASVTYNPGIKANSKVEFRDMTVTRTGGWDFQRDKAAVTNILVRFSNVYSSGGMMGMSAASSRLEFIDSEITCSSRFNFGSSNSVLLVSSSKFTVNGNDFHFGADVGIKGPVEMIISGKDSRISANKFYVYGHSDGYDATITLMVPVGGFAEAPLQQTGDVKFQNGGGANSKIKFAVSPASPALRRSEPVLSNHVIVEALKKGFETARTGDGNGGIGDSQAGVPGWAFKWGANREPTDASAARQILLDLQGKSNPPTMFVIY